MDSIHEQLAKLPHGKLICARNGSSIKWYLRTDKGLTYLPKQERALAEQLALRKYLTLRAQELLQEKKAIDFYHRHLSPPKYSSTQLLEAGSPYLELLSPLFSIQSQELSIWANEPYEHNPLHREQCIHKTSSGNWARSKSEAIIDMLLSIHQIPFRYECALALNETTVYPDFTIQHPVTGAYFYWEHLGMMDEVSYYTHACDKIKLYAANGIYPGMQLILTSETKAEPLSTETVQNFIEGYLGG